MWRGIPHAVVIAALMLTGCAKETSQVGPTYISPVTYESYTCPQLAEEAQRVSPPQNVWSADKSWLRRVQPTFPTSSSCTDLKTPDRFRKA
jgi:hypothetical protein